MNRKGLTTKELKQLKSKFDKLKTYPEKITFWEENVLPYTDYETHILVPPNTPNSEIDNLHHNPKNVLSIEPKDANERGEYLKWKERIIQQKLKELNLLKVEIEQQKKVDANAAKTLAKYYENGVWINPIGIDSKQYDNLKTKTSESVSKPQFKTFEELYNSAYSQGLRLDSDTDRTPAAKENKKSLANLLFNTWLSEKYDWVVGDSETYFKNLNLTAYKEFLKAYIQETKKGNLKWQQLMEQNRVEIGLEEQGTSKELEIEPLEFKNLSQKLLLLESLGVLKALSEKTGEGIASRKMGRIIADLIQEKETTTTRALRYFHPHTQPKGKNNPRTENNLTALHKNLVKLNLPHIEKEVEEALRTVMLESD